MTEDELESVLHGMISDTVQYIDGELSPTRARATDYYLGKPFGNEQEGRSQVVLTEVRDAVQGVLPQLLRVFFGASQVVEYTPMDEGDVAAAEQATDYVQHIFTVDNPGFLETHSVLLDGLVRKMGVYKWWWQDAYHCARKMHCTPEELQQIVAADPEIQLTRVGEPDEEGLVDVELTQVEREGCARFCAIPPNEFGYSREARTLDDALMVFHRTEKTRSELLEMGIKAKDIDEYGHRDLSLQGNQEQIARNESVSDEVSGFQHDPEAGPENDKILYIEAYPKIDYDGDDIAELRRICTIGPSYHVVINEPADERPFSIYCPSPEPHTLTGQSWADRVEDLQRVKSFVLRATLDSAAASIFPRTAYVEGQANVEDILNTEIGAPVRMRAPGMVMPLETPFIGQQMFPVLEYLNSVQEARTGTNKGTVALDADALQSSTSKAVSAAVTAAQAQTELLARIFAEQALKPLFRGLLRLLVTHQPRQRMVRLRNKWVPIDPRGWNAGMDVSVNVALGVGFPEDKIAVLEAIAAKQEAILSQFGPQNPLVSVAQYRNTLARAIELHGFKDTHAFFNDVDPNWQPPPQQDQGPSPEQQLVQIEGQKAQIAAQHKQQELELKVQSQQVEAQLKAADQQTQIALEQQKLELERQKLEADVALRLKEMELKYQVELETARFEAELMDNRERAKLEVETAQKERDSQRQAMMQDAHSQRQADLAERDAQREHHKGMTEIAAKHDIAERDRQTKSTTADKDRAAKSKTADKDRVSPDAEPKAEAKKEGPRRIRFVRDDKDRLTGVEDVDDPTRKIEIVRD
jgi:hypothetical protein